ncbi:nuclease-related domain-containing protein [Fundicoccus culcitae]|uniref:NERD domain-containing protein n=1 Tax=Fundicoccus culcitae TaxID=2969821 RepID=A0ABY5PAF1_9LACT|nr:nuclease-related domain-containing protein [Fundicoccus culcitae]UUX35398.1 NERD domain-containing protein [Fundicoccus culcitae]
MKINYELQQLEILKQRHLSLTTVQSNRLFTLRQGDEGEYEVSKYLNHFASPHWHIIADYWFDKGKLMQVDFIIIIDYRWLILEVKNYDGFFRYENRQCTINGSSMDNDIVYQMHTRLNYLKEIAATVDSQIEVAGAMIFIGETSEVAIKDGVNFEIVLRHQLRSYLRRERQVSDYPMTSWYIDECLKALESFRVPNPFMPKSISDNQYSSLQKGVPCKKCGEFHLHNAKKSFVCNACGTRENKADTILRMTHQLRLLFFDHPEKITVANVHKLVRGEINKLTIQRTLDKAYVRLGKRRSYYYDIPLDDPNQLPLI